MAYKQNIAASEYHDKIDREGSIQRLSFIFKKAVLAKEMKKALFLIKEAKLFAYRNLHNEGHYCQRCLKAHIIKKAQRLKMSNDSIKFIDVLSGFETGHLGYYLDDGKIGKV